MIYVCVLFKYLLCVLCYVLYVCVLCYVLCVLL